MVAAVGKPMYPRPMIETLENGNDIGQVHLLLGVQAGLKRKRLSTNFSFGH